MEEEEEHEEHEQTAEDALAARADLLALKTAVEWGMDFDTATPSPSRTLPVDAEDSDASSHHEVDDRHDEKDEEEEDYLEKGEPRELSPTLPAPSSETNPRATVSRENGEGEAYQPLFPVTQPGHTAEVGWQRPLYLTADGGRRHGVRRGFAVRDVQLLHRLARERGTEWTCLVYAVVDHDRAVSLPLIPVAS